MERGSLRYVLLDSLREGPRHGYEIIKALEERMHGYYSPSAGSVYPTLQMLEDQGFVRIVEEDGKKVYHITPEGERFLDENEDVLTDISERIKEAVRGVAGGAVADVNTTFAQLAKRVFTDAWRSGPDSSCPRTSCSKRCGRGSWSRMTRWSRASASFAARSVTPMRS